MSALLEVKNLVKSYADLTAVNGLDLSIRQGICFGLLGPNGAGKTTTIEIMEGISKATSGEVLFKSQPLGKNFHEQAGIQFQSTALQDFLTVKETLTLFSKLYHRSVDLDELSRLCSLEDFLHRESNKLSGGQRQRLLLALALVNDPEIIFLDEPTTGLDPQSRRHFWDLIESIKARNKTIILTTHYMEEAYTLCDEIGIMDKGKMIALGTPEQLLRDHFGNKVVQLPVEDNLVTLKNLPFPGQVKNHFYEIETDDLNQLLHTLVNAGISLQSLKLRDWNLEDLFLSLTGKALRQ